MRQAIRMRDRHLLEEAVLGAEESGVATTNNEMRKALKMLEVIQLRHSTVHPPIFATLLFADLKYFATLNIYLSNLTHKHVGSSRRTKL